MKGADLPKGEGGFWDHAAAAALLVAAVLAAFWPVLHNGFVNWDDNYFLLETAAWRGLGLSNLRWMFTTFYQDSYAPLSWLSYALDYKLWGLNPLGYHLTNLLLHAANVLLVYALSWRLLALAMPETFKTRGKNLVFAALFAALSFGVHPLRVESVAWASERRDVLCGFFYLLALLFYLNANSAAVKLGSRRRWLSVAVVAGALALLSKVMAVSLPLALIILDVYPLRRLDWDMRRWLDPERRRIVAEKIPFLVLALAAGVMTYAGKNPVPQGVIAPLRHYGVLSRLAQMFYGLAFYLWKTALPIHLSPLYEKPPQPILWQWPYLACAMFAIAISVAAVFLRRRWPSVLALWLFYAVTLAPVLGIVEYGAQMAADRYSYLPCLACALLAGASLGWLLGLAKNWASKGLIFAAAALIVCAWGALTRAQTRVWHDSTVLWRRVIALDPNSDFAHVNLGNTLLGQGQITEAVAEYGKALACNPGNLDALYNLGQVQAQIARPKEAAAEFRRAIAVYPGFGGFYYHLGGVLAAEGKTQEAERNYEKTIELVPDFAPVYLDLGNLFASQGKTALAAARYQAALRINPEFFQAHYDLGVVLATQGQKDAAIAEFKSAVVINPQFAPAQERLRELSHPEK